MSKVAIFPGQGAQKPGMGKDLCETFPEAKRVFDRADEVLDFPIGETCVNADADVVNRTDVCQPGIFLVSAATMEVLREREGVAPEDFGVAAGLSLGEYTALWFAGALTLEDGLALTRLRGQLMQEASDAEPSGMTSIMGLDPEKVEEACAEVRGQGGIVCVANLNSPGQVVISGATDAVAEAAEIASGLGARRAIPLPVAGAFHSPLMAPASEGLAKRLAETEIRPPRIPVVANVTAAPMTEPAQIRENLVRQLVNPVLWERSMRRLLEEGHGPFVEPGPGTVLAGLMKKIDRSVEVLGYPDASAIGGEEPSR
ncbi:MAG: ACP S-malonyltransferase [Planctomycetota bacterium]|jgi:[acyl-carrier-protein] S-malonyltransferase